jgi:hypothetical protein
MDAPDLARLRPEHRTRGDLDPREHLAEARERLTAATANLRSPLYAVGALADARAEIDAAMLMLVRQLRLAQWPPPWERIGEALGGISKQAAYERYGRQVHHDGEL